MNFSLLSIQTGLVFYILAVICFCAFCVVLLCYLLKQKKDKGNVQSKSWTIESAKKFLEANNINVKEVSNEKVVQSQKSESQNSQSSQEQEQSSPKPALTQKQQPDKANKAPNIANFKPQNLQSSQNKSIEKTKIQKQSNTEKQTKDNKTN